MTSVRAGIFSLGLCLTSLLWRVPAAAAAAEPVSWPAITLPSNVRTFPVGEQITQNGLPLRVTGFVSPQSEAQLAAWFRQDWGMPYVEDHLGAARIIGRARGEFYVSVQLEALLGTDGQPAGTRGLAAVTHLGGALARQEATQAATERWLERLPPGSQLLSQTASRDGATYSRHMIFVNPHDETVNRERLQSVLAQDGLQFEHAVSSAAPTFQSGGGQTLYFSGTGQEAVAVITRTADGQVATVLNITTRLQQRP